MSRRKRLIAAFLTCLAVTACRATPPVQTAASGIDPNNELPFGYIDAPGPGAHLPRTFVATGWALDDASVVAIRVFIDSKFFMPVDRRMPRDDLNAFFPAYTKNTRRNGWTANVNLPDTTSPGAHTLLVQLTDTGGLTRDLGPVTFVLDPAGPPIATTSSSPPPTLTGEMPFGLVDQPKVDAHVPLTFDVAGWALDDRGVKEIRVFVDRAFHTVLVGNADRQDVLTANPKYAATNPKPGWMGALTLTAGPHSLIFQAVDTDGLTRVLAIVPVVVEK